MLALEQSAEKVTLSAGDAHHSDPSWLRACDMLLTQEPLPVMSESNSEIIF